MKNKLSRFAAMGSLLVVFGLVTVLSTVSLASDYISNFEKIPAVQNVPPRVATWKRTPTVIICNSAPINESQAAKAVKFWKALGHRFLTTQFHYDPLDKCRNMTPIGYIVVQLITQETKLDEDSLAVTHFYVNNDTNEVDWAIIYLKKDIRDTVLEHELGHALGYLHFNKINHVMNSKWTQGGWDTDGLEWKQR